VFDNNHMNHELCQFTVICAEKLVTNIFRIKLWSVDKYLPIDWTCEINNSTVHDYGKLGQKVNEIHPFSNAFSNLSLGSFALTQIDDLTSQLEVVRDD